MTRTAAILMLSLVMGVAGCQSMKNARDRIVRAPPPTCRDATVPVYFEQDVAELTPEGRRVVAEAAGRAKGCDVKSVSVVGLADATGDPATNLELSKRRAASVTAALASAGLTGPELQVAAQGDVGAVTADGAAAPLRRRADITFHVAPPK